VLKIFSLGLAVALLFSPTLYAASGPEQLEYFLSQVRTLEAEFTQTILEDGAGKETEAKGRLLLERPSKFRWDYTEPNPQQIVADGRQVWFYDPELHQASVQRQEQALAGTPALLLASAEPLEKHFTVNDLGTQEGMQWVELLPKDEEVQFDRILIAFRDERVNRMDVADKLGHLMRFRFTYLVQNGPIDEALFKFNPPPGYELFEH